MYVCETKTANQIQVKFELKVENVSCTNEKVNVVAANKLSCC